MSIKKCNSCFRVYREDVDFLIETSRWRMGPQEMLFFNCSCGSTLAIPRGKFPYYSPDINLSESQKTIFNTLGLGETVPTINPKLYKAHYALTLDDDNIPEVAKLIKTEPATAATLLEIATSKTSYSKPITSIEHAINYLGRKTVANLLLLSDLKHLTLPTKVFSLEAFWQQSLLTGFIAERLAERFLNKNVQEIAYLAGCLANIGKVIVGMHNPDLLDLIAKRVQDSGSTWIVQELELGMNHIVLGEIGASFWAFPDRVISCIQHHHDNRIDRSLKSVVALAVQIAHVAQSEDSLIDHSVLQQGLELFGLTETELEEFINGVEHEFQIAS